MTMKLTIRKTDLDTFLLRVDFSKQSKPINVETLKAKYFSGKFALTKEQEVELRHICLMIEFAEKNQSNGVSWISDEQSIEVRISLDGNRDLLQKNQYLLENVLQSETEIIIEGSSAKLLEDVVAWISHALEALGSRSKLSRFVLQKSELTEAGLKQIIALPNAAKKDITFTQYPDPNAVTYGVEVSASRAMTGNFSVDYRCPFEGELTLAKVMSLAPEDSLRKVNIECVLVDLARLKELMPLVAENCDTVLKKVAGKWCFNVSPAKDQTDVKHAMYVDTKSSAEELQPLMECVKPQAIEFGKNAFNIRVSFPDSIKLITIIDTILDDDFLDRIQALSNLRELDLLESDFVNSAQRKKFIQEILPRLKLMSLTLDGCALDGENSEQLADFLRRDQHLRKLKITNAINGFLPINLASVVVCEANNTLIDFVDDAGSAGKSVDLMKSLNRNQRFKKFIEDKESYNNTLRAFDAGMRMPNPPDVKQFIRNLETLYAAFSSLVQSYSNVTAYKNNDLVKTFPDAEKLQQVKASLCADLLFYFEHYAKKEQDFEPLENLYNWILKFFLVAHQSETKLLAKYFAVVIIREDNYEFACALLKKAQTAYRSFDVKPLMKKFYEDSLGTFVHSGNIPNAAWWNIFLSLCDVDFQGLKKEDKIELLKKFVFITFEKYLLPQLRTQFTESPKLGNKSIDPKIVEQVLLNPNITLNDLYKQLHLIWGANVQAVLVPFTGGLPLCDKIVATLLQHLNRVWPDLFEARTSTPVNLALIARFSSVITAAPAASTPAFAIAAPTLMPPPSLKPPG